MTDDVKPDTTCPICGEDHGELPVITKAWGRPELMRDGRDYVVLSGPHSQVTPFRQPTKESAETELRLRDPDRTP